MVQMNQQVADNLQRIITSLEADGGAAEETTEAVPDAP